MAGGRGTRSIDEVLARMDEIDAALPHDDGVAYFNRMYRETTRYVEAAVDRGLFIGGDFLVRLDCLFADLFFEAYEADRRRDRIPDAWWPLFDNRARANTCPIQFAIAGMNTHICHDLPHAVVQTMREIDSTPVEGGPEHTDYLVINDVLKKVEPEVKQWFSTGLIATVDEAGGKIDDALAMWSILTARSVAWESAQMIWELADGPILGKLFSASLRRSVAFASRAILL